MSEIDELWVEVCGGNRRAFGDWMGRVERPIRNTLAPFARAIDAEGAVQETLMRMWIHAQDRGHVLEGENSSLRYAIGMARNLARNLVRKHGKEELLPPGEMPEPGIEPGPVSSPSLARAISECMEKIARKPLAALLARLRLTAELSDRVIAAQLGMSTNAFLQNIVRARRQLAACLEGKGIELEELGR